jgi:predicted DNA-binding protein
MDTTITFQLSDELREALETEAQKDGRSLGGYIRKILSRKLLQKDTNGLARGVKTTKPSRKKAS